MQSGFRIAAGMLVSALLGAGAPEDWIPMRWPGAGALDLLKGSPVNCLLTDGPAEESASEARKRGIVVAPSPSPGAGPVLYTSDSVTARIRPLEVATATPTSEPWIDSNLWLLQSLRSQAGARPVWLGHRLENPLPADYERAIAEAAAAGGRWVVSLDEALLSGLRDGRSDALALWRRIGACLEFHERHAEWRGFAPVAALGIVRDRAGENAALSDENLNLITRRRIPYRLIERAGLSAGALEGLPAVLATDLAPPTERERKLLAGFAARGGRVIQFEGDTPDPETLALDLSDLLGGDNLPVRLFNAASVLPQVTAGAGGAPLLVQLINYATEPADQMTVRVRGNYRGARLFRPHAPPMDLKVRAARGSTEVRVEEVAVYAALLFEK